MLVFLKGAWVAIQGLFVVVMLLGVALALLIPIGAFAKVVWYCLLYGWQLIA